MFVDVSRSDSKRPKEKSHVKHSGGSVIGWRYFSKCRVKPLVLFEGNMDHIYTVTIPSTIPNI